MENLMDTCGAGDQYGADFVLGVILGSDPV
jgi:hypothetical protein